MSAILSRIKSAFTRDDPSIDNLDFTDDRTTIFDTNDSDRLPIVREDVTLPDCFKGKLAFVLYNVLTPEECKWYIWKTEQMGYTEAQVNIGGGKQKLIKDVRNNDRCIWDSFEESGILWDRIKSYIPEVRSGRKVLGLNERLRFLKYAPGQFFKEHFDGIYMRDNGERSYITIQLYLNEGFKGGSTTFLDWDGERFEVVPKTVTGDMETTCYDGWLTFEGNCYLIGHDAFTFPEAEHYCNQHQAHLLEITNKLENAFIKDRLRDLKPHNWWLAITDEQVEGVWRYYTLGTVANFTDWHPSQPDLSAYGEDCGILWYAFDFQWGDLHCNVPSYPICKRSGIEGGEVVIGK